MNTLENKAKFFAQYWGQEIVRTSAGHKHNVCQYINLSHESFYLSLKPLSSITDEDFDISYDGVMKVLDEDTGLEPDAIMVDHIAAIDYLRSKGYALPWNGISVEQQIEYGWIKLQTDGHTN